MKTFNKKIRVFKTREHSAMIAKNYNVFRTRRRVGYSNIHSVVRNEKTFRIAKGKAIIRR